MERTTIYLDPSLKRRLKEVAGARGLKEAVLVREALESYLEREPRPRLEPVGASEDGGVARRTDDALDELGFGQS